MRRARWFASLALALPAYICVIGGMALRDVALLLAAGADLIAGPQQGDA